MHFQNLGHVREVVPSGYAVVVLMKNGNLEMHGEPKPVAGHMTARELQMLLSGAMYYDEQAMVLTEQLFESTAVNNYFFDGRLQKGGVHLSEKQKEMVIAALKEDPYVVLLQVFRYKLQQFHGSKMPVSVNGYKGLWLVKPGDEFKLAPYVPGSGWYFQCNEEFVLKGYAM